MRIRGHIKGRFDVSRKLVAQKAMTVAGERVEAGEGLDRFNIPDRRRRQLWEQRKARYGEGVRSDWPEPIPSFTRPVQEIIAEREARDPEFRARLEGEMANLEQEIDYDALPPVPDSAKTIDSIWRDMFDDPDVIHAHEELSLALGKAKKGAFRNWPSLHHKTLVRIANECGGDVSSKDEAIAHLTGLVSGGE